MRLPLIVDHLRNADDDRVGQVQVGLDREAGEDGRGRGQRPLERLADRRTIGHADIGSLERGERRAEAIAEIDRVALENDRGGRGREATGLLQLGAQILDLQSGADREPIVDLVADGRRDVDGHELGRTPVNLGGVNLVFRLGTQAIGRAGGHADPEPVSQLPGAGRSRDDGAIAANIAGAELDRVQRRRRVRAADPRGRRRLIVAIGVEIGVVPVAVAAGKHGDGRRVPGHRAHTDSARSRAGKGHAEAFGALAAADGE